ncbi:Mog1p/PsbP-like protein [Jaminaea rosea]|uniref:Mog1p/PsbP-like protein n=1 Tax=Jaminaea rosea TaxID=1569628 RepID=A0A316V3C9_9BASI|nr:Mog1p/PsbP-like protein [Jaminaea rosea]PWN31041.1 Mog1p/PsbP-like protein [Jaminaea rosea]
MAISNQQTEKRELFGGAITLDMPQGLIDASDLRQIPDNQEVLLSPSSDVTCIVEVLESVKEGEAKDDTEAALRFHFSSLAHDNDAESSRILTLQPSPASASSSDSDPPSPSLLTGVQQVRKFAKPDQPLDNVLIHFALYRLAPRKDVDLVMSWNEPLKSSDGRTEETPRGDANVAEAFRRAAQSLKIVDWGLFQ